MRALFAQLSPHEENTLRRIARGEVVRQELPFTHVAHLERLTLIEDIGGFIRLTEVGSQRHANLDRPEQWISAAVLLPARHARH